LEQAGVLIFFEMARVPRVSTSSPSTSSKGSISVAAASRS
jgi:hypothetical protein